jgi:hypothetical protein
MEGGGGMAQMSWRRQRSLVCANMRGEGPKNRNRAIVARFRAAFELQGIGGGAVGL